MRRLWPTAAAACLCGRLLGYSGSPSFSMPHTMAPEETITISRPCAFNVASSLASWSMRSVFRPRPLEATRRSEEHTSELQSLAYLVCRLLLEKKKKKEDTI